MPTMTPQVSIVMPSMDDPKEQKLKSEQAAGGATHVTDIAFDDGWEAPFFGCFASLVPNCCMSTICPCVSLAQVKAQLGKPFCPALLNYGATIFGLVVCIILFISHSVTTDTTTTTVRGQREVEERSSKDRQIIFAIGALFFFVFYVISVCRLRLQVRKQYDIKGTCGLDFLLSVWCTPCAVAQIASQTRSYTPGNCSFQSPNPTATLPAYTIGETPMSAPIAFI